MCERNVEGRVGVVDGVWGGYWVEDGRLFGGVFRWAGYWDVWSGWSLGTWVVVWGIGQAP